MALVSLGLDVCNAGKDLLWSADFSVCRKEESLWCARSKKTNSLWGGDVNIHTGAPHGPAVGVCEIV